MIIAMLLPRPGGDRELFVCAVAADATLSELLQVAAHVVQVFDLVQLEQDADPDLALHERGWVRGREWRKLATAQIAVVVATQAVN